MHPFVCTNRFCTPSVQVCAHSSIACVPLPHKNDAPSLFRAVGMAAREIRETTMKMVFQTFFPRLQLTIVGTSQYTDFEKIPLGCVQKLYNQPNRSIAHPGYSNVIQSGLE